MVCHHLCHSIESKAQAWADSQGHDSGMVLLHLHGITAPVWCELLLEDEHLLAHGTPQFG